MAAHGTRRMYHEDAYRTDFTAEVVERRSVEGRAAVVLDQTCFYPESGGQPWDRGRLDGVEVVSVIEDGESIVHVLAGDLAADRVRGTVDWTARFDHMQQHTGQHILSQAFIEVVNGETRSFHLGPDVATLEIGVGSIADEALDRVERRANAVVFENRAVKTYFVPPEGVAAIPFRRPPKKEGVLRVVEVEGFDYSACGGTHCRTTGEVGLIKVTGWDRIRGNLRFTFVCGGRALADYQTKNRVVRSLVGRLNCVAADIPAAVEKLASEVKAAKKDMKRLDERAASFEARDIIAGVSSPVIVRVFRDRSPDAVRALALSVARQGMFVALFAAVADERSHLVLARGDGVAFDMRRLVPVVGPLVSGRGGGGPSLVEIAGAPNADVAAALERAARLVAEDDSTVRKDG